MAGVWKRDGTVTVTSGSKRVIGVGTTFADPKNGVAKGHIFTQISGSAIDLYEVDYVVSNTELYLVQAFRGATASGAAYAIITTFSDSIPEFSRKLTATLASYQEQSDVLQLLYTSDAAEITVTAPDGTVRKLIPWRRVTSEGEGQAARAKVEADRAKTEADKAAQAVIDSAVPFPDVWIPFNDSLRMFAGYGREVKVGDDVVARMVNFERSTIATYTDKSGVLRTAAINEPRFEKQGLLIEGQSTNLIPWSSPTSVQAGLTSVGRAVASYASSGGVIFTASDTTSPQWGQVQATGLSSQPLGVLYSGSAWLSASKAGEYKLDLTSRPFAGGAESAMGASSSVYLDETPRRFAISRPTVGGEGQISLRVTWSSTGALGESVTMNRVQIEALPFASSYIPTAGASVTRSADKCWINTVNNMRIPIRGLTFSMNVSIQNPVDSRLIEVNDANTVILSSQSQAMFPRFGRMEQAGVKYSIGASKVAFRITDGGEITSYVGGTVYSDPASSAGTDGDTVMIALGNTRAFAPNRGLFGHIRDLKVWHTVLSDAQIKGVK